MIDNSYYSQDGHGPYELHDIGNLELEEGGTIRGCTLAYATFWHAQCRQRQRHPHSHLVLRHQQDHPRASWPVWVTGGKSRSEHISPGCPPTADLDSGSQERIKPRLAAIESED
jgi:hypothetical protein